MNNSLVIAASSEAEAAELKQILETEGAEDITIQVRKGIAVGATVDDATLARLKTRFRDSILEFVRVGVAWRCECGWYNVEEATQCANCNGHKPEAK